MSGAIDEALIERVARALDPAAWGDSPRRWATSEKGDASRRQLSLKRARAIVPIVGKACSALADKRREERFAEHGTTEPDTNHSYYSGRYGETFEALDEEDEAIALAICSATGATT